MNNQSLDIAIIGTRGVPASYGGFETFAEEVAKELLNLGHKVTVYGRRGFGDREDREGEYKGIRYIKTPTFFHKYLETPVNSITAYLDAIKREFDVVLVCNAANAPFSFILKAGSLPFALNVDGIEKNRGKWNFLGRVWYSLGERATVFFANKIVADADVIADYYRNKYKQEPKVIRYGAHENRRMPGDVLQEFKLEKDGYILYVSRLEPENNAHTVIKAYQQLNTDLPLVIVGDAPYAKEYIDGLKKEASNYPVIFTGFQFGKAYQELRSNCLFYIQATEVGGTHPALVEAMANGNGVIANDVPEHREVLQDMGLYYQFNDYVDLALKMDLFLNNHEMIRDFGEKAKKHAEQHYQWSSIARQYEELFFRMLA